MSTAATPQRDDRWQSMSEDSYAALELATGSKVSRVGELWWRQVRPFFHRALLPYRKYDLTIAKDGINKIGAFQHGVEDGQLSNSHLNPIVFEEPGTYDMKNLRPNARGHIRKALKNGVTVSRIVNEQEFTESAYPCYLSFYERTKYAFLANRRKKEKFAQWSQALFQYPGVVVLGAFVEQELVAFQICCLVEDTLILKSLVASSKALQVVAPDLLVHTCRTLASQQPNLRLIYDSLLGQSPGINEFYIARGARVWALPSYLHMPAPSLKLIRKSHKGIYQRLLGLSENDLLQGGSSSVE